VRRLPLKLRKPAEQFESLDAVKDQIRQQLATQRAATKIELFSIASLS
jgi:hypothetical protein